MINQITSVYVDPTLPHYPYLTESVTSCGGFKLVDEVDTSQIQALYAHDNQMCMTPLLEFNTKCRNNGRISKTIFFSWFDWYNIEQRRIFFIDYFNPENTWLWDIDIVRFIQLPSLNTVIVENLNNLKHAQ